MYSIQTRTSKATSVNSTRVPAVFHDSKLWADVQHAREAGKVPMIVDMGCGKFWKLTERYVRAHNCGYLPLDPYNLPREQHEANSWWLLMAHMAPETIGEEADKYYFIGVLSNVLNVIDDIEEMSAVVDYMAKKCSVTYVTVYEGNRTGHGRETRPDCWQRNMKLKDYPQYIMYHEFFNFDFHGRVMTITAKNPEEVQRLIEEEEAQERAWLKDLEF